MSGEVKVSVTVAAPVVYLRNMRQSMPSRSGDNCHRCTRRTAIITCLARVRASRRVYYAGRTRAACLGGVCSILIGIVHVRATSDGGQD